MARKANYWLLKSEPETYSIDDLQSDGSSCWDGVRNYQARNFMRDEMQVGDWVLFYHSSARPPAVAGLARVCRVGYPDFTAFDAKSRYYDPDSDPDDPRWYMIDVEFVEKFSQPVALQSLKDDQHLADMRVVQRGQRLSVQPVEKKHFRRVLKLAKSRARLR